MAGNTPFSQWRKIAMATWHSRNDMFKISKAISWVLPPMLLRAFLARTTLITEDLQIPLPPRSGGPSVWLHAGHQYRFIRP